MSKDTQAGLKQEMWVISTIPVKIATRITEVKAAAVVTMEAVAMVTIHIIKMEVIKQTQSLNVLYVKNSTLAYADTRESLNVVDEIDLDTTQMIVMRNKNDNTK